MDLNYEPFMPDFDVYVFGADSRKRAATVRPHIFPYLKSVTVTVPDNLWGFDFAVQLVILRAN